MIVFINHKNPSQTNHPANLHKINAQLQAKGLDPLAIINGNAKKVDDPGINELLENIVTLSDFRSNLQVPANGVIIDNYLHPQTSSRINELLVEGGKLQEKDVIFLDGKFGKVKMMFDIYGNKIMTAYPGQLVQVIGLVSSAELGDKFVVVNSEKAKEVIEKELASYLVKKDKLAPLAVSKEKKNVNLILVTDSQNALEALKDLIKKKNLPNFSFSVVYTAIGNLNNSAIELAKITESIILAFGLQFNQSLIKVLKQNNIPFFDNKIIYEIDDKLDEVICGQQEKKQVEKKCGVAQITNVFYFSKTGKIAGCRVVDGVISRNNFVHVFRKEEKFFTGKIESLQSNKVVVKEAKRGQECGIVFKDFDNFQEGDQIIAFQMVQENVSQS